MSSENQHIDYYNLTAKYLSGEASDEEVQRLELWVKSDEGNKKSFRDYKQAWKLSHTEKVDFDTIDAWNNIENTLFAEEKTIPLKAERPSISRSLIFKIAAGFIILLSFSFLLFYYINRNSVVELVAEGKPVIETLEEGSVVSLNQNSILSLSKKFNTNERRVSLEGDAFFEVAKDESKPFIIETGEVIVQVLGTSFYVDARDQKGEISVIVNSGRVKLTAGKQSIELKAGETGLYNKQTEAFYTGISKDRNYISWKTKQMTFENTPLIEVVRIIMQTYHIKIQITNPEINNCMLTSRFNDLELEEVLEIINETFQTINITKEDNIYLFSGKACDDL